MCSYITSKMAFFDIELDVLLLSINEGFMDNSIMIPFYVGLKPELPTREMFLLLIAIEQVFI